MTEEKQTHVLTKAVPVYFRYLAAPADISRSALNLPVSVVMVPTDSELETVSCVRVDVFEGFLHGQSEQNQLAEMMPRILTLLNVLE